MVSLALLLAGLGLILWLASADATRAGAAYRQAGKPAEPLFDGRRVGQIIVPPLDQLVGLRLWLRRPANRRGGTIALRVRSLEQHKDLASVELPVAELAEDGPTTFNLPVLAAAPIQINRPETLELMLTTHGVDQSDPVGIGVGGNGYGYGLMVRDGKEIARTDLMFETLYRARLLDRIFPITTIAYGRPGIFGWPPLYALLVYGVLAALGHFACWVFRTALRAPAQS
jgi:hypothetical protein